MAFIPSKELTETGRAIYLYGALGVISRLFFVHLESIPGVELKWPADSPPSLTPAGILGVVVLFRLVSFVVRAVVELTTSEIGLLERAKKQVQKERGIDPLHPAENPAVELLLYRLEERIGLVRLTNSISYWLSGIVEMLLPCVFGVVAMAVLWPPTIDFLGEAGHRILGVLP